MKNTTNNADVTKLSQYFNKLTVDDIAKIKDFCEVTKMIFNAKVEKYDFNAHKNNIRLCNFGKSDTCRTASVWYSPARYDYAVRIESSTRKNLMRSSRNEFLLNNCYNAIESQETNKENEYRYSFSSLNSALKFFSTLQNNYKEQVVNTKETKELVSVESVSA